MLTFISRSNGAKTITSRFPDREFHGFDQIGRDFASTDLPDTQARRYCGMASASVVPYPYRMSGTECLTFDDWGSYCDGSVCRASNRRWPIATHTVGATLRSRPATRRGDTLCKQMFEFIDAFYWYGYGTAPRNRKGAGHFYNESAIVRPGVFFDTFPLH